MNFFKLIFLNLFGFLFASKPFVIEVDSTKLFVNPRSMDMFVVAETYLDKMYDTEYLKGIKIENIVDLGAHIGDSSVWLVRRFNPEKLFAVEMDRNSFTLLERNVVLNKLEDKIVAINKAIYSEDNKDMVYRKSGISMMNSLSRGLGKTKVKTISLKKISDNYKIKTIDYLKMDIEGAEKFLFTKKNNGFFRDKVRFIVVECHPNISLSHEAVRKYLENLGFDIEAQKTTILNSHNKTLHAINKSLITKFIGPRVRH